MALLDTIRDSAEIGLSLKKKKKIKITTLGGENMTTITETPIENPVETAVKPTIEENQAKAQTGVDANTLVEVRGDTHGPFNTNADFTIGIMRQYVLPQKHLTSVEVEAIHMIVHKLARAIFGTTPNVDDYRDIAGYATLVVKDLEGKPGVFDPLAKK